MSLFILKLQGLILIGLFKVINYILNQALGAYLLFQLLIVALSVSIVSLYSIKKKTKKVSGIHNSFSRIFNILQNKKLLYTNFCMDMKYVHQPMSKRLTFGTKKSLKNCRFFVISTIFQSPSRDLIHQAILIFYFLCNIHDVFLHIKNNFS